VSRSTVGKVQAKDGTGRRARPVLTGRALLLGGVFVLLVVLLASPVHRYLGSRSDIATNSQQLHQDQQRLRDLQRQKDRWGDPGYVQQQARKRLQYAMPGDVVYVVVDKGERTEIEKTAGHPVTAARNKDWSKRLWDSVRAADR
jgi:cell division protein FtsB